VRRAAKVDRNHNEVVDAFRAIGCSVQSLAAQGNGCPDLLVHCPLPGYLLVEVKDGQLPPSARKLTPDQERWHAAWRGPVHVVKSVDEAIALGRNVKEAQ
jgi:hypothetical protein